MKKQKRYYTYKFNSDRLKKFKYDIQLDVKSAVANKELIAIFENQIIDCILSITGRGNDYKEVYSLNKQIKAIKQEESTPENAELLKELQLAIDNLMLVPEYITIQMDNKKQYAELYKNGVKINGVKYRRFNSSASQARVDTVLFIAETVYDELLKRTDNGRDLNKAIAPAKLNAYRGLYCSSRYEVSTPRFCVVKDYESETTFKVDFVTETDKNEDDEIKEGKEITKMFNRFDGQGLISPSYAKKWANELGLKYTPAQWCIRGSFLKGMLCVFDIHEFCKQKNNGNYMIETIYKDENDEYIKVDLREIDVIITESQLKLWDSWKSVEHYNQCCKENGLTWGVSLFTPEFDKTFFYQNYQFLQTLNLDKDAVAKVTSKFVNWIKGVTSENVYYTMLFLTGMNGKEDKFKKILEGIESEWIKALILEPKLIESKYFRTKVYNMLKKKIQNASLGQIIVDGNFQVLVSDPYGMMESICGRINGTHPEGFIAKGLLERGCHFSNYWNNLNIKKVVGSRSPLTYRSEHVILNLVKNKDTDYWYQYCTSGIILNAHGEETDRFAGSDFDYDILATTSDESIINGVFENELPIVYDAPKPKKVIPTNDDLYRADTFSFNSIIGGLTNKSTAGYALLATFEKGSREYDVTLKRIKTITKAQSAQIDKTKIGQEVKGIVPKWVKFQKATEGETEEQRLEREFNNRLLLDKHPYFFIHLYKGTKKKYKEHVKKYEILALQTLGLTLLKLKQKERLTDDELNFMDNYYRFSPVIESDCVMNRICRRIETVDFNIKQLLRDDTDNTYHELFLSDDVLFDEDTYKLIKKKYIDYNKQVRGTMNNSIDYDAQEDVEGAVREISLMRKNLKEELLAVCNNERELCNYIIHLFYNDGGGNKDLMWSLFGDVIVENLKQKKKKIIVPINDEDGEIEYLNNKYTLKEVELF